MVKEKQHQYCDVRVTVELARVVCCDVSVDDSKWVIFIDEKAIVNVQMFS
jgi:hypothetical protein